uniref:Uncharacterized protein n=1 Tax=Ditylenchus dipsaci TaxID=166011 RepID=A0A915CWG8_9BILA
MPSQTTASPSNHLPLTSIHLEERDYAAQKCWVASRFSVPTSICNPKCNSFPPSNKPVKLDTGIACRSLDTGLDKQQKAGAKVVVKESSDSSGTKRPTTASSPNSGDTSNSKVRSCNIDHDSNYKRLILKFGFEEIHLYVRVLLEKTDVKIHAPDDLSSQQLMDLGVIQQNYADSSVYNQVPRGDQEHNNNTNYLNVDPYNRKQKSSSSASGISITYSPPTYTDAASRDTNIRSGITLLEQLIKSHPICVAKVEPTNYFQSVAHIHS